MSNIEKKKVIENSPTKQRTPTQLPSQKDVGIFFAQSKNTKDMSSMVNDSSDSEEEESDDIQVTTENGSDKKRKKCSIDLMTKKVKKIRKNFDSNVTFVDEIENENSEGISISFEQSTKNILQDSLSSNIELTIKNKSEDSKNKESYIDSQGTDTLEGLDDLFEDEWSFKKDKDTIEELDGFFEDDWSYDKEDTIDFNVPTRCLIIDIIWDKSDITLTVKDPKKGTTSIVKCLGLWRYTKLEPGEPVVIKAKKESTEAKHWIIDNNSGWIINQPDTLISGTSVVGALFCNRRSVFQEKFRQIESLPYNNVGNNYMLTGSLSHELLQTVLDRGISDLKHISALFEEIVKSKHAIMMMYSAGTSMAECKNLMRPAVAQIYKFVQRYIIGAQPEVADQNFDGKIEKIYDIEENVWLPSLGLKGKIDLTVEVSTKSKNKLFTNEERRILPLELKTGKASFSSEHQGQLILYTMMMDMTGRKTDSGLLLYLRENIMKEIKGSVHAQRDLITLRNTVAYYSTRQAAIVKTKDTESIQPMELPKPINHRACTTCPFNALCTTYLTEGDRKELNDNHVLNSLMEKVESYLSPEHIEYVKKWVSLMQLEENTENQDQTTWKDVWTVKPSKRYSILRTLGGQNFFQFSSRGAFSSYQHENTHFSPEHRKEIWHFRCREKRGSCISNMNLIAVIERSGRFFHKFQKPKEDDNLTDINATDFCEDEYVIISTNDRINIASGFVNNVTSTTITIHCEKLEHTIFFTTPTLNVPHFLPGSKGAMWIFGSFVVKNSIRTTGVKLNRPDLVFELDNRNQFTRDLDCPSFFLPRNITRVYKDNVFHIDKSSYSNFLMHNLSQLGGLLDNHEICSRLRKIVIERQPATFTTELPQSTLEVGKDIFEKLNEDQKQAILKALSADDYLLVKGFPGTGKTQTLVAMIELLVRLDKSVLVTAHTNTALDNILLKLLDRNVDFIRLGSSSRAHSELVDKLDDTITSNCESPEALHTIYCSKKVVGVTCYGTTHAHLGRRKFDICIVDESTQVLQPTILRPLYCASKFILVGDPEQLPPIAKNNTARKLGINESLFSRLDSDNNTIALTLQYRMNSYIMDVANKLTYHDQLKVGNESVGNAILPVSDKTILETCERWIKKALSLRLKNSTILLNTFATHHLTLDPSLPEKKGNSNYWEAAIIVRLIEVLKELGIDTQTIGIIAPYRAQVRLLKSTFPTDIEVNTVDQYQGRDKSVIIYSCSKSISKDTGIQEFDILEDLQRLTVAVTRAKHKLIIIGDLNTLERFNPFNKLIAVLRNHDRIYDLKDGEDDFCFDDLIRLLT